MLERCPASHYSTFDFSAAIHKLSKSKLIISELNRVDYILGEPKQPDWTDRLKQYEVMIIHQALHELPHKAYATDFHKTVKSSLLRTGASYLVCDHLFAENAMSNSELYMSKQEHLDCLQQKEIAIPLEIKDLCIFECHSLVIT
ncbi:hypothetical protein [Acinetobacter sp. ANC 3903]|uniref:hypothetical protein n=1 Tax=Acinetobacter sp. ANC 3903 TaxID=1977883 RepID=UPI002ADFA4C4|nr:hypothetical protein [Acinetobacter sp. ANC 3903]